MTDDFIYQEFKPMTQHEAYLKICKKLKLRTPLEAYREWITLCEYTDGSLAPNNWDAKIYRHELDKALSKLDITELYEVYKLCNVNSTSIMKDINLLVSREDMELERPIQEIINFDTGYCEEKQLLAYVEACLHSSISSQLQWNLPRVIEKEISKEILKFAMHGGLSGAGS